MLLNYSEFYIYKNTSHYIVGLLAESSIQLTFYYRTDKKHSFPQNNTYLITIIIKNHVILSWTFLRALSFVSLTLRLQTLK